VTRKATGGSREVILDAASDLFSQDDMRAVGIDAIVSRAGVAKATLYRHFRSKDEIVVAFLRRRADFVRKSLEDALCDEALTPRARLLAVFKGLEWWCARPEFRGSAFAAAAVEFADTRHPAWRVVAEHIGFVGDWLGARAREANLRDPDRLGRQLTMLIEGAVAVALMRQDPSAAREAHLAAEALIDAAS
jgi:AcrR family transcriptional regulator